jgi:hypothetical protein
MSNKFDFNKKEVNPMKKITVILYIFIFAGLALAQLSTPSKTLFVDFPKPAEIQLTEISDDNGKTATYIVSTTDLNNSPEWNGTGEPPLSISTAISLAKDWLKKQYPEFKNFKVRDVSLTCVGEWNIENRWYYNVSFWATTVVGKVEESNNFDKILLLNGKFVEPKIKQE